MTDEEYEIRYQMSLLYQPLHQKIISTDNMQTSPIEPVLFAQHVEKYFQDIGVVFSTQTRPVIEGICKLFNYCILLNKNSISKSMVYPAQTGIGKSIALQLYLSMLKNESSVIIVSQVDEAIKYCDFINRYSNDKNYARCYYSISPSHQDKQVRVEIQQLKNYRCIVITHAMFKLVNQKLSLDPFKVYQTKNRDLVVVDEKIQFYELYQITDKEIDALIDRLSHILATTQWASDTEEFSELNVFLINLSNILKELNTNTNKNKPILLVEKDQIYCPMDIDRFLDVATLLIKSKIDDLFVELKILGNLSNMTFKTKIIDNMTELLTRIKEVLSDNFLYFGGDNRKKVIFKQTNILNRLGSTVILDATANINEFYKVANRYGQTMSYVSLQNIRIYKNLNIYKAKGYKQTRCAIYRQDKDIVERNAEVYMSYALSVLSSATDKMLIICHEKFKSFLQAINNDQRIVFTHWGNHVGKNDWNDCNKVMVIGWNTLDTMAYISSIYSAINDDICVAAELITDDALDNFRKTQIADDLIQAVMRSIARVVSSEDSDCKAASIYLFYEEDKTSLEILNLFESQFPQANIIDWQPIGKPIVKKITKVQARMFEILALLKEKEVDNQTYLLSDITKELGVNKSTMHRIMSSPSFMQMLDERGYKLGMRDHKSIHFILK